MSIFPYAYRMIETFNLTHDETEISIYAGMLITAFAFAEFSTGVLWGRISDKIGRKPVLLLGLLGTALSMISFGFSRSLSAAIISRALGGLLNGNVGVLQTTVAELVTSKEQQPRAYSIMPFVWCLGSIIGPAMGGALAMPCEAYPWLFPKDGLFDTYPFLLPNLVCMLILLCGIVNGLLFLEETHTEKKHKRDWGLQLGNVIRARFVVDTKRLLPDEYAQARCDDERIGLTPQDPPPGYQSTKGSPRIASFAVPRDIEKGGPTKENNGLTQIFNRQVILVIIGYGILAYHSVSFDSLMPTFLSEPRSEHPATLPFLFTGGFALSTKTIGFMIAVQGIYSMVAQLLFFPFLIRHLGTLRAFRMVMMVWPFLYLLVPYLVLLPPRLQTAGIYGALLIKITFHVVAFPSNAILLTNAAPSKSVLGPINGVAASTACLARAFGPTVTGSIHSLGLRFGCNGLAWWAGGLVCAMGAIESFMMEEGDGRMDRPIEQEEQTVCEPLLHSTVEAAEKLDETPAPRHSLDMAEALDLSIVKA